MWWIHECKLIVPNVGIGHFNQWPIVIETTKIVLEKHYKSTQDESIGNSYNMKTYCEVFHVQNRIKNAHFPRYLCRRMIAWLRHGMCPLVVQFKENK